MKLRSRSALAFSCLAVGSVLALGGSMAACSSDDAVSAQPQPVVPPVPPAPDADAPDAADAAPPKAVPKPTFPEVKTRGGPVIKAPRVVPILYAGDDLATQITEFTGKIATSTYWKNVGQEYGVGAMTAGDTITVSEAAPTTITSGAIETWLKQQLTGATPAFGVPDANTLYAIYYPASTTIKMDGQGELGQSCQGYGGYHFEIDVAGKTVGYAVLPRCSTIDELTVAASHEYFEWATDPFPKSKPAYNTLDADHWAWQAAFIGELGDLCTFLDRDNLRPAEVGYEIQRQWSNKLSLAGSYPCAPTKTAPYLQAIPTTEDEAIVPDYGDPAFKKQITTKAIRVKPGGSKTVDVLVYSDQPITAQVPMRALGYNEFYGRAGQSGFTFSLDESYGTAGKTVALTVTAPKDPSYDLLVMLAYTGKESVNYWPVLVVNDDASDVDAGIRSIIPNGVPTPATAASAFARPSRRLPPITKLGLRRAH